jgi:hypothetical protein
LPTSSRDGGKTQGRKPMNSWSSRGLSSRGSTSRPFYRTRSASPVCITVLRYTIETAASSCWVIRVSDLILFAAGIVLLAIASWIGITRREDPLSQIFAGIGTANIPLPSDAQAHRGDFISSCGPSRASVLVCWAFDIVGERSRGIGYGLENVPVCRSRTRWGGRNLSPISCTT